MLAGMIIAGEGTPLMWFFLVIEAVVAAVMVRALQGASSQPGWDAVLRWSDTRRSTTLGSARVLTSPRSS